MIKRSEKKNTFEQKFYGLNACLALWQNRPQDIIRVYVLKSHLKVFSDTLKWCAKQKKAYHVVDRADLEKISGSVHHEGVCFLAKKRPFMDQETFIKNFLPKLTSPCCLLYFDGVQNPHNLGSVVRSAVHFGVPFVFANLDKVNIFTPAAARIAKGGFEYLTWVNVDNPPKLFKAFKQKEILCVGTDSAAQADLFATRLAKRTLFILGGETKGVSAPVQAHTDTMIKIPGSNNLASLNVAAASAILCGEFWRQTSVPPRL